MKKLLSLVAENWLLLSILLLMLVVNIHAAAERQRPVNQFILLSTVLLTMIAGKELARESNMPVTRERLIRERWIVGLLVAEVIGSCFVCFILEGFELYRITQILLCVCLVDRLVHLPRKRKNSSSTP